MNKMEKSPSSEFRVASRRCPARPALLAMCLLLAGISPDAAMAGINFNISFNDPGGQYASYYGALTTHTRAAGAEWAYQLSTSSNVSLEVEIRFGANPTANGGSATSNFLRNNGVYNIFEQGAAAEIRTGIDPNGAAADINFTIGTNYLANELFFSADPFNRSLPVPANRTDAVSVLMHEFGHAWGFNGWRTSGSLPGDYASTFDEPQTFDGTTPFFIGATATALYGGPVPLTQGNSNHVGNSSPRPGSDLQQDLMNGVVFQRGVRYSISPLDLAILRDIGVRLRFPGDTNDDRVVDFTDLGILLNHYALPGTFDMGDFNSTGTVDFTDLGILLNNYNQHAPALATAAPVPEPSTLLLGCFTMFGLFVAIRHRLKIGARAAD